MKLTLRYRTTSIFLAVEVRLDTKGVIAQS